MLHAAQTQSRSIQMRIFSEDQIWEIRQAAFDIVEKVGFTCPHRAAQKMLAAAGAWVKGERIRLPRHIAEACLATTPKGWTLYDRDGQRAMEVEGRKSYYGTATASPHTRDLHTGEIRDTRLSDIANGAKVADACDHIDFVMPMGSSQDLPPNTADVNEFPTVVANTTKPLVFIGYTPLGCEYVYEMAAVVAGGMDALRQKPFVIAYPEGIAPLFYPEDTIERIFVSADRFMPQLPGATIQAGATGPVTLAGMTAQMTAEAIIHIVIAQLRQPGCPVAMSANAAVLNMTTALNTMGAPELSLAQCAQAEVARSFQLPTWGLAGASDSKTLDAQAGLEAAFSILSQGMGGLNLIHDVGYLAAGMICSLEQLVMGDEIIGMAKRFISGITVNRETLAREVIEAVGPRGHFLQQRHTMTHFKKELWRPRLLDQTAIETWTQAGRPTLETRVRERAIAILETHRPKGLPVKTAAELERLSQEAHQEILAKQEKI